MAKTILDILVSKGLLDLNEAGQIRKEAKDKNLGLDEILYARGVKEVDAAEAKSELTGLPTKYLQGVRLPFEVLRDIPEESARHYKMIPLGRNEGYLDIGMLNPDDVAAKEALKFIAARLNLPPRTFIISPWDFDFIRQE